MIIFLYIIGMLYTAYLLKKEKKEINIYFLRSLVSPIVNTTLRLFIEECILILFFPITLFYLFKLKNKDE